MTASFKMNKTPEKNPNQQSPQWRSAEVKITHCSKTSGDLRTARSPDVPPKLPIHQKSKTEKKKTKSNSSPEHRCDIFSGVFYSSPRTPTRFIARSISDVSMESTLLISPGDYEDSDEDPHDYQDSTDFEDSEDLNAALESMALSNNLSERSKGSLALESRCSSLQHPFIGTPPDIPIEPVEEFEVPISSSTNRKSSSGWPGTRPPRRNQLHSELNSSCRSLDALPQQPMRRASLQRNAPGNFSSRSFEGFSRMDSCETTSSLGDFSPIVPRRKGSEK